MCCAAVWGGRQRRPVRREDIWDEKRIADFSKVPPQFLGLRVEGEQLAIVGDEQVPSLSKETEVVWKHCRQSRLPDETSIIDAQLEDTSTSTNIDECLVNSQPGRGANIGRRSLRLKLPKQSVFDDVVREDKAH